jgi:hypothetical protein
VRKLEIHLGCSTIARRPARQLSLSVRSLDYLVANKKLEFRRIGKKVLITHASLVRFSQANHFESVAAA